MKTYDYLENVKEDVRNYIEENRIVVTSSNRFELLTEALTESGCDLSCLEKGAEACDVTIRCYLLGQAISEVLDETEIEMED